LKLLYSKSGEYKPSEIKIKKKEFDKDVKMVKKSLFIKIEESFTSSKKILMVR